MNGRFKILLRRRQNQQDGVDVIVQCNAVTNIAEYVPGTVDNTTPFIGITPVAGWYDFTNYIENAEKLSFTWDKINSGNSNNSTTTQDGSNYDKGLSSDLMFFDKAFQFIYDWFLVNECQILNAIEVKIIDLIAGGTYRLFEIKNDNIEYAPIDEPCQFKIKLREQDNVWHCIHKTFIWDDHLGWFKSGLKEHPCFFTCIEPRPRLISSARVALVIFYHSVSFGALGAVGFLADLLFTENMYEEIRRILNANRFVDAPLIRTYIENVAQKCNLETDTIFDEGQEWENLCLYYPQAGYMHESDDNALLSPALTYHFDNRWLITIAELFDKLKTVFGAEWYVTPNNTIVFKHVKDLINLEPIYDFTAEDAEPIYELRYTFNGDKKPAYGRYEYQTDGSDLASQEMSTLYNDIIDYDGKINNPMLEGERRKNFEFAPTGFVRDGRSKDYLRLLIEDGKKGAFIIMVVLAIVAASLLDGGITAPAFLVLAALGAITVAGIIANTNNLKEHFAENPVYDGAVRVTSEQVLTPRLILWDGFNMQRAKAVAEINLPEPNPFYNPDLVPYNDKNKIAEDNPDLNVYNYPLYFDGDFKDNMFDKYHDPIDNPLKSLETHQDVRWYVDACEGMLNLFGVFQNQYAQIGKVVKLEERAGYDVYARIGNISVDYDTHRINLKGKVIKRRGVPDEEVDCLTFEINEDCLLINGHFIKINVA